MAQQSWALEISMSGGSQSPATSVLENPTASCGLQVTAHRHSHTYIDKNKIFSRPKELPIENYYCSLKILKTAT